MPKFTFALQFNANRQNRSSQYSFERLLHIFLEMCIILNLAIAFLPSLKPVWLSGFSSTKQSQDMGV
jgi:hypothetical protein